MRKLTISKELFLELWKLNPNIPEQYKNQENTWYLLKNICKQNEVTFDDKEIDFDFIYKRYKKYVLKWQETYRDTKENFIAKDNKLKCFYDYLELKMYKGDVMETNPESDPRFNLCFMGNNSEELEKQHIVFKNLICKN